MVGHILYVREKGSRELSLSYVEALPIMTARFCAPEGLSERRAEKRLLALEKALCRQGVGRVILPEAFPYAHLLERLRPVEVLPFYRDVADVLVLARLSGCGIPARLSRIALAAPRLCPELCRAAERLCSQVRELVIRVPKGGEDYARLLHSRYGLPVIPCSVRADVTVAFGPGEDMGGDTLRLYGSDPELKGLRLSAEGVEPPEDSAAPVLALLWESGQLNRERLRATFCGQTLANG